MKYIRKLSNYDFQWTGTLMYQNNFKQIAFFFTLFKSCNKLHEIAPKK